MLCQRFHINIHIKDVLLPPSLLVNVKQLTSNNSQKPASCKVEHFLTFRAVARIP